MRAKRILESSVGMDIRIKCDHCGQTMPRRNWEEDEKGDDFLIKPKKTNEERGQMALTAGIVGFYQTLKRQHYLMQLQKQGSKQRNYLFATIDPNVVEW